VSSPTADVSVRIAWADDAEAIAKIQARAWATSYAGLVPGAGDLREADFAQLWRDALTHPADARHRALLQFADAAVQGLEAVEGRAGGEIIALDEADGQAATGELVGDGQPVHAAAGDDRMEARGRQALQVPLH